jgi:branched-chain amino acid transport system substrate-binding protein
MKRRNLLWRAGAAMVMVAGLLSSHACGQNGSKEPIKVGHFGSMTGKEATFGQSTDNGIRLALEEINKQGGFKGQPIDLITYDDKGESKEAGTAVTRLITSDHVTAVLGEVASSLSLAGGQVCEQHGVPMISPSSTNPRVTAGKKMIFRVCFTDPNQAAALAAFVRDNLKLSKAAILFDQTQAYSKGLRDDFTKAFTKMGGTIVEDQPYSGGDQDFAAQLNTIKAKSPEIIFIPGYYTEGGNIAIQARKLGIKVPLIGGDGWDSSQLTAIGQTAIEGCYYSNHSAPDQPNMKDFVEKYKAKYGATPDALGGLGYDAMMVLFDSMKRTTEPTDAEIKAEAEKSHEQPGEVRQKLYRQNLAKAISETKGFKGVTGIITIDKNHDAQKGVVIVKIKEGAPVFDAAVDPAEVLAKYEKK